MKYIGPVLICVPTLCNGPSTSYIVVQLSSFRRLYPHSALPRNCFEGTQSLTTKKCITYIL